MTQETASIMTVVKCWTHEDNADGMKKISIIKYGLVLNCSNLVLSSQPKKNSPFFFIQKYFHACRHNFPILYRSYCIVRQCNA